MTSWNQEHESLCIVIRKYSEFHGRINIRIGSNTVPLSLIVRAFTGHRQAVGSQSREQVCCPCQFFDAVTSIRTHCALRKPLCIQSVKNCILEKGSSSLHNSAFPLVVEQVGLLGTGTRANNYWFLVALLLMVCCCVRCCWGGAANKFHLDSLGCFLVLIKSIIPLGPRAFFKKLHSETESLTRKVLPCWAGCMLGLQWFLGAEAQSNTASNPHALSPQALTLLWKKEIFQSSWLYAKSGWAGESINSST